jgi:hypothetical protein
MTADAEDLAYNLIRVAADCLAKACMSEVYPDYDAMLEALSTALSGRLGKIKRARFPVAHARMAQLQELIEGARTAGAEASPS